MARELNKIKYNILNMKHLVQIITEGNINRIERKYREFVGMCKTYDPNIDMNDICIRKTSKNNWAIYKKENGEWKKLFIASYLVLDDDIIKTNNIELCTESLNEAKNNLMYEIAFLQYDPDVQADYEDGDADEDELHDSADESTYERVALNATSDREALHQAETIIKKMINKHPELCGGTIYDRDGDIIKTLFI